MIMAFCFSFLGDMPQQQDNTGFKRPTKVQEVGERTSIVPPKRHGPVLRVNDDDDEDNVETLVTRPPESIGSGTLIPSNGRIPAWRLDDSIGPDAEILSPPSKKTGPRKADKGGDILLRKRRGPVVKLGDDEADGTGLSLKPTSRRQPGTLPTASRSCRQCLVRENERHTLILTLKHRVDTIIRLCNSGQNQRA